MSFNSSVSLFSGQSSDATGAAVKLMPESKNQARIYHVFLSGNLGDGSFSLDISFDGGVTYSNYLINGTTEFQQNKLGFSYKIEVETEMYVKGVLADSTSPNLTAKLFYREKYT